MRNGVDMASVLHDNTLCKGKPVRLMHLYGAGPWLQSRHSNMSLAGLSSTHWQGSQGCETGQQDC